ncbi:hypothetical protein MPL3356_60526 [Mesorhizobium plurifarium]|uniref:Uncharacterized protein n=1 Tax=Mesorhizobium plurifarium TaxID=69974 RepID=A0A090G6W8_MESPL|nr:hypothetical protein MPL3356_60526 [Mesorhizobium plurifarium]
MTEAQSEMVVIKMEDAKVIVAMMEEFWRKHELSLEEERAFLSLYTRANIGRPVPEHGSGP